MARAPSPARKARARSRGKEKPSHLNQVAGFWRRPTLARPIAVLPSGLQRFTAVFGMGTGGATALLSPEIRAGLADRAGRAVSALRADADIWRRCRSVKELWFSDIYIQEVKAN